MADREKGTPLGYCSRSRTSDQEVSALANTLSIAQLRTRLAAINAGYYTAARLNEMSQNDMVYAMRLADAPGTI